MAPNLLHITVRRVWWGEIWSWYDKAIENSQKENNNDKDTNSDSFSGSANNYNNGE